jgi:fumarate hydratase subunit beta
MDAYAPALIALGLRGMIGKGKRSPGVVEAMIRYGAVYFGAIGGAGALLAGRVKEAEVIAFGGLGAEAVHRLVVEDFPAITVIDSRGNNLYETGRDAYLRSLREP